MARGRLALVLGGLVLLSAAGGAQTTADEEVARRQLDSGRSFLRQGDYTEALKDFRAVAETHASSSVADDALLEIARYYIDIAGDLKQASAAVDAILQKYPTSNSAPDAYVIAGRLALARSHQGADLDAALANFERVFRLFPESPAVPRALQYAGETLWYSHRLDDALADLGRVEVEYPTDPAAAGAYLNASLVRVSQGDPVTAMEELQEIRNRWPASPEASTALARLTLLHRLYVRARGGPAYALSPDALGPPKLQNLLALAVDARGTLYWATETSLGSAAPAGVKATPTPADVAKPRGLALDSAGVLVVLDGGLLRPATGASVACVLPRPNGQVASLSKLNAAAQVSNGDWIVMDDDERAIHRFSKTGTYVGPFAPVRVSRLAVNAFDEVAGLDRDQKSVVLLDITGKVVGRIPLKAAGYDLQDAEDLAYDAFGHLYVLARTAIGVFSPYAAPAAGAAPAPGTRPAPAPAGGDRGAAYHLALLFSEPEKSTTGFHKATALAVDPSGSIYLYDDRAQRIMVYR